MAKKDALAALHNTFNCPEILSPLDLSKALSFLSETNDSKKQKQWVLSYMKKRTFPDDLLTKVSKIKDAYFPTIGSLCRLLDVGKKLPNIYDDEFVKSKIVELSEKITLNEVKEEKKIVIVAKTPETLKAENLFYFIDLEIEKFIKDKKIPEVPHQLISSNKPELDILKEWIEEPWKKELEYLEASKDDEFYSEAYSNLSQRQKNALKKFYLSILSLIENKEQSIVVLPKETTSKPRKVREKKKESKKQRDSKLFSKFVYQKKFNTIESFSPSKILSSSEIYLLDTKYRKLIYLKAKEGETFSIKSMSISNIDEEKSLNKKIPTKLFEVIVAAILKSNQGRAKIIFNETESTPSKAIGKCNENILLLKAF
jgi:hypothetical protein